MRTIFIRIGIGFLTVLFLLPFQHCGKFNSISAANQSSLDLGETLDPIQNHPSSQMIALNGEALLTVELRSKISSPQYQWHLRAIGQTNFLPLPGATNAIHTISRFGFNDQGDYKVTIKSGETILESHIANLKVVGQNNSCSLSDLPKFSSPLDGNPGRTWSIMNYNDADPLLNQIKDFMNNIGIDAVTYDGHKGIDFTFPNFRYMDAGQNIRAATPGIVEVAVDGNFDRNTERILGAMPNYVLVRSPNGFVTGYYHMKNGSVLVTPGTPVSSGQIIGRVGSSGYSNAPHLHIETKNCAGETLDLAKEMQFTEPYQYEPARMLMDFDARTTPVTSYTEALNTAPQPITSSASGQTFFFTYTFSNLRRTDTLRADFINPTGGLEFSIPHSVTGARFYGVYVFWGNANLITPGTWRIRMILNGAQVENRVWMVQ